MRRWRIKLRAVSCRWRGRTPIMDLPVELFMLIFSLLPLPSQVCFALTCKGIYYAFGSVLSDERLEFPRVLSGKRLELPLNREDLPRNKLLTQIANSRWVYCSVCVKLHPPTDFLTGELEKIQPSRRHCKRARPIAHLCPCLSLTARDQDLLETWLRTGHVDRVNRTTQQFRILQDHAGERYLFHECFITDNPDAFVRIEMKLSTTGYPFKVQTIHHLRLVVSSSQPMPIRRRRMKPVWLCPGLDLLHVAYERPLEFCRECTASAKVIRRLEAGQLVLVQGDRTLSRYSSHWYLEGSEPWGRYQMALPRSSY